MTQKWIVFRAEPDQPGWKDRRLQHTQSLTRILAEQFDSSNGKIPEPGYRPFEFLKLDNSDPLGGKTHYRKSDWEVTKVETYTPDIPLGEFDEIVVCFCQYNPIDAALQLMPERQVSPDSFDGDKEAYQQWRENNGNETAQQILETT